LQGEDERTPPPPLPPPFSSFRVARPVRRWAPLPFRPSVPLSVFASGDTPHAYRSPFFPLFFSPLPPPFLFSLPDDRGTYLKPARPSLSPLLRRGNERFSFSLTITYSPRRFIHMNQAFSLLFFFSPSAEQEERIGQEPFFRLLSLFFLPLRPDGEQGRKERSRMHPSLPFPSFRFFSRLPIFGLHSKNKRKQGRRLLLPRSSQRK